MYVTVSIVLLNIWMSLCVYIEALIYIATIRRVIQSIVLNIKLVQLDRDLA